MPYLSYSMVTNKRLKYGYKNTWKIPRATEYVIDDRTKEFKGFHGKF